MLISGFSLNFVSTNWYDPRIKIAEDVLGAKDIYIKRKEYFLSSTNQKGNCGTYFRNGSQHAMLLSLLLKVLVSGSF